MLKPARRLRTESCRVGLLIATIAILGGALPISAPALRSFNATQDESLSWGPWYNYEATYHAIRRLPSWPTDRDFTDEEWRKYITLAYQIQKSRPEVVHTAYVLFMYQANHYGPDGKSWDWNDATLDEKRDATGDKIMLLNRLVFEIPDDTLARHFMEGPYYSVQACGGLPCTEDGNSADPARVGDPIGFTREGYPTMSYYSGLHNAAMALMRRLDYEPANEYMWMQEQFEKRDLQSFLTDDELAFLGPLVH